MQTISGIIGIVGLAVFIAGIVYLVKAKKSGATKKQGVIFLCAGILVLFVSGSIAPKPVTPAASTSGFPSSSVAIASSSSASTAANTSSTVQSVATSIILTEIPQAEKEKIKTAVEKAIPEKYKGSFYTTDILTSTAGFPMVSTQLDNNVFLKESERIAAAKALFQSLIDEKDLTKVTSFEISFIADSKLVQFITLEDFSKLTTENIEQSMKIQSESKPVSNSLGIDEALYNDIKDKYEQIGIEDISKITQIDDWENGKCFSVTYEDYIFTAYEQNGTIATLKCGDVDFYANGAVINTVQDKIVTSSQKTRLMIESEDAVKNQLKAPSTAKFPGMILESDEWEVTKDGDTFYVLSYVDSQNSFGAMIRTRFIAQYTWGGDDSTAPTLVSATLEE